MDNLLFFDFETTGVDPYTDRIVELFFHVPGKFQLLQEAKRVLDAHHGNGAAAL